MGYKRRWATNVRTACKRCGGTAAWHSPKDSPTNYLAAVTFDAQRGAWVVRTGPDGAPLRHRCDEEFPLCPLGCGLHHRHPEAEPSPEACRKYLAAREAVRETARNRARAAEHYRRLGRPD